jgi:hypothetical protein
MVGLPAARLRALRSLRYLAPSESADEKMVTQIFTSWNQMVSWLRQLQGLRRAA